MVQKDSLQSSTSPDEASFDEGVKAGPPPPRGQPVSDLGEPGIDRRTLGGSHQLPLYRYAIAVASIAVAAIQAWLFVALAPVNPNPFSGGAPRFSLEWWLEVQESNAPLRLPILDTSASPVSIAASGTRATISFDDRAKATIFADGTVDSSPATGILDGGSRVTLPFEADSSSLNAIARARLDELLGVLQATPAHSQVTDQKGPGLNPSSTADQGFPWSLLIAGHTTSDRAREYNLALGERLAMSVRSYLEANGIPSSAMKTISYGEERPLYPAPDDDRNRRVEVQIDPPLVDQSLVRSISTEPANYRWRGKLLRAEFLTVSDGGSRWRVSDLGIVQHAGNDVGWQTIMATTTAVSRYFDQERDGKSAEPSAWREATPRIYPPPVAVAIAVVLAVLSIALLTVPPRARTNTRSTVQDFFVSDAPIDDLENDRLNFGPVAVSLSQFLRNERTLPPLTVAVTGPWGSGKSSLMKLLQNDLRIHRLRPIWVNAWHHQNESQFLAGLMERIRQDALPPVFSAANIIFQVNLLWLRVKSRPFRSVAALALITVPLGYFWATGNFWIPGEPLPNTETGVAFSSAIGSLILFMQMWGSKIASLTGNGWFRRLLGLNRTSLDLRSMVGLREQFITEFDNLCDALKPTTLTIFIDDLDRCNEKRVLDVLETVNFLVTSGNCYVVLGMEEDPVERAVIAYYRDTHTDLAEDEIRAKARRYLEKLINIEVPVPRIRTEGYAALVGSGEKRSSQDIWLSAVSRVAAGLACTAVLLWSGVWIGQSLTYEASGDPTAVVTSDQGNTPADDGGSSDRADSAGTVQTLAAHAPEENLSIVWGLLLVILAIFAFVVLERIRQRQHVVVTDSRTFESSVSLWGKALGDLGPTPRRIKRFLNRTRYLAMRSNNSDANLGEDDVVTLAGIYEIDGDLFASDAVLDSSQVLGRLDDHLTPENLSSVRDLVRENCNPERRTDLHRFRSWVAGIDIR